MIAFEKPVVYVHGDTHYFRVDKPLLDKDGKRPENFTRVETSATTPSTGQKGLRNLLRAGVA